MIKCTNRFWNNLHQVLS